LEATGLLNVPYYPTLSICGLVTDTGSEVSESGLRERREQEEKRETAAQNAAGGVWDAEELLLFLATPPFMASAGDE